MAENYFNNWMCKRNYRDELTNEPAVRYSVTEYNCLSI